MTISRNCHQVDTSLVHKLKFMQPEGASLGCSRWSDRPRGVPLRVRVQPQGRSQMELMYKNVSSAIVFGAV